MCACAFGACRGDPCEAKVEQLKEQLDAAVTTLDSLNAECESAKLRRGRGRLCAAVPLCLLVSLRVCVVVCLCRLCRPPVCVCC
eukprot:COSAG02_NODE_37920_length_435_cov_1.854167_1_plen_83_part_10